MENNDISQEIKEMHNFPTTNIIVMLTGKDGMLVHGYRPALLAGSPVFKSMLTCTVDQDGNHFGWAESQQTQICFPGLSSTVLFPVVKYIDIVFRIENFEPRSLVSDEIQNSLKVIPEILEKQQTDWEEAFEIILAARFFLLRAPFEVPISWMQLGTDGYNPDTEITLIHETFYEVNFPSAIQLEDIVWEFLYRMVEGILRLPEEEELVTAAYALSILKEFKKLVPSVLLHRYYPRDFLADKVENLLLVILSRRILEPFHLPYFSFEAFRDLLIYERHIHYGGTSPLFFEYYVKVRHAILWSIWQLSPKLAVTVSNQYLPNPHLAMRLLDRHHDLQYYRPPKDAFQFLNSIMLMDQFHINNLEELLSAVGVQFVLMPPGLFSKIVEPFVTVFCPSSLDMFCLGPSQEKPNWMPDLVFETRWSYDREAHYAREYHGPYLQYRNDDPQTKYAVLLATWKLPMWPGFGSYEWEVVIETPANHTRNKFCYFPKIGILGPIPARYLTLWKEEDLLSWPLWGFTIKSSGQCMLSPSIDDLDRQWEWRSYGKKVVYLHRVIKVIRIHLDMLERSCIVYYRGIQFSRGWRKLLAWRNMPRGGYIPAIQFSGPYPIRTHIDPVSGFRRSETSRYRVPFYHELLMQTSLNNRN